MTARRSSTRPVPHSIDELLRAQRSMLSGNLPLGYGAIETVEEALEAAKVPPPTVSLRIHIVWDNDATNLDIERALEVMRETGAAMVTKVEQVTR